MGCKGPLSKRRRKLCGVEFFDQVHSRVICGRFKHKGERHREVYVSSWNTDTEARKLRDRKYMDIYSIASIKDQGRIK